MNKKVLKLILIFVSTSIWAEIPLTTGYEPGKFTQDYDAAIKYAQEYDLPIFLNFTGSDWCSWCQLMMKNVFSHQEWPNYAKANMVLITLDFPQNSNLVPQEYVSRNSMLKDQFNIKGFPTYIILDSDGITEIERTGAGKDKTVESFILELKTIIMFSQSNLTKFSEKLNGDIQKSYKESISEYSKVQKVITNWYKSNPEKHLDEIKSSIFLVQQNYAISKMSQEDKKKYDKAKDNYNIELEAYTTWISSDPINNEENNLIYNNYLSKMRLYSNIYDKIIMKYLDE